MNYTPAHVAIRLYREERGWSQQALAKVSGLSLRTILRIEKGKPCNAESLKMLANAFDLPDFSQLLDSTPPTANESPTSEEPNVIRIDHIECAEDLLKLLPGHQLFNPDFPEACKDPIIRQTIASFFDTVMDLLDILPDLSFSNRVTIASELQTELDHLNSEHQYNLLAGSSTRTIEPPPNPLVFRVLHLRFAKLEDCIQVPVELLQTSAA